MKYYVIAGEASGDLHAANLIKELKQKDSQFNCRAWGGDRMQAEGANVVKHYKELAFMGFVEVLMNIRTIFKNIKACKKDILIYKPDVVILVDYPGFNLRIAEFLKENNIKTFYYISPQVWAWKKGRVKKIKKVVDKMFVILPFEKPFYKELGYEVDFEGHPLLDEIDSFKKKSLSSEEFKKQNKFPNKKIIALLPGSRTQEIKKKLPIMLSVVNKFPAYQFVIAGAPSQEKAFYDELTIGFNVPVIHAKTYNLLNNSHAALVTSGTATLETALFKVPQVVCYKANAISYQIAKKLIRVAYISLVNLILNKEAVKELIQGELNTQNLQKELGDILEGKKREDMLVMYEELNNKLGGVGASEKIARLMIKYLKQIN